MSSDTEVELTAQQKWTKMTKDDPPWHYRRAKKLDKAAYCKPGVDIKRPLSAFEEGVDYFSDRRMLFMLGKPARLPVIRSGSDSIS